MRGAARDPLYAFFAVNYLAQGLIGVVYEPLAYLLKDGLGLSAGQSAAFVSWMTLPFLAKPLLGALSDALDARGLSRAAQLRGAGALAAGAWLCAALAGAPSYGLLLALMVLANAGLASADVACDAVMVRRGKASGKTGPYQAAQLSMLYLSLVVTGLGGGYLARHASPGVVFALAALFALAILASAAWAGSSGSAVPISEAAAGLRELAARPAAWALALVIFLWSFNPLLGTAMFYHQAGALGFGPVFIGALSTLAGAAGVLGAAYFGRWTLARRGSERLARAAVWLGAPLASLYVFYRGPASAVLISLLLGFTGVVFRLALMDLAARASPARAEAAAFSAYMAVFNLSAWASNALGGRLYDRLLASFAGGPDPAREAASVLALVAAACTVACWPLLPAALRAAGSRTGATDGRAGTSRPT